MEFIADLHVHSKYSRATAKNLDLENLYIAAQLKGVTVVGTGDFTYPAWFSEICEKLEPAEPGLFKLKKDYAKYCDQDIPQSCRNKVRFILTTEISNIYKKIIKPAKITIWSFCRIWRLLKSLMSNLIISATLNPTEGRFWAWMPAIF